MLRSKGHARGGIVLSCIALVSVFAMANAASAAEFSWTTPSGVAPGGAFSYQTGKNVGVANLYGDPTVLAVGFDFNNTLNFTALGDGVNAGLAANIASTLVQAAAPVLKITVKEFGTWLAPGGEDPATIFPFTGILALQSINPFVPGAQPSNFSSSIVFNLDGTWTAEGTLIPSGGGFTIGSVSVNNELRVLAAATAGSTFEKLGSTVTVPEPTTIALLAGLAPLALRRRRRS